jgi:hypothetical protein
MKLNLTNGLSIDSDHALYLSPSPEGDEHGTSAPDYPFYLCSRDKHHNGDCAAHGGQGRGKIVMFARWDRNETKDSAGQVQDDEGEERFEEAMTTYEKPVEDEEFDMGYTDDDGRPLGVV